MLELVQNHIVSGWDDPRMPTIAGLRRRGYTAQSIRTFWKEAGVSKADSIIPMGVLENAVRNDMNEKAPRVMAVLDPVRLIGGGAEAGLSIRFILGVVSIKPDRSTITLEGKDMGGNTV